MMKNRNLILIFIAALVIAFLSGIFASSSPDGLEKVAKDLKFDSKALSTPGVFSDDPIPFIGNSIFLSAVAGVFGLILIVFMLRSMAHLHHVRDMLARLLRLERKYEK